MQKLIPNDAVLVPPEAELKFQGEIFNVYQWQQKLFDGSSATFEMLKRTDTVIAICVVEDKILIVDDEQPYFGNRQGFPGGRIDDNDSSIEAAAAREVREETGYSFKNWRTIDVRQPYDKVEWFVHVVLGWQVSGRGEPHPDAGEKITTELITFDKLTERIQKKIGSFGNAQTLFENLATFDDLLNKPAFNGQLVGR
jgi:ADP-ribose pyrophosphatase